MSRESMNRRRLLTGLTAGLTVLGAGLALSACGKKGRVKLPEEKAGQATFPRQYPPPESVNPGAVSSNGQPAPEPVPEAAPEVQDPYYQPLQDDEDDEFESAE